MEPSGWAHGLVFAVIFHNGQVLLPFVELVARIDPDREMIQGHIGLFSLGKAVFSLRWVAKSFTCITKPNASFIIVKIWSLSNSTYQPQNNFV